MPRRISPTLLDLPDKYFFTIGEASQLTWVKPAMLRYWETRFKPLRPARRESGQRKYTRRDIGIIKRIRALLRDEKLTIEGARNQLKRELKGGDSSGTTASLPHRSSSSVLREIKQEIQEMARELNSTD
jgi:DNA-binding transcriptional MerR regulator